MVPVLILAGTRQKIYHTVLVIRVLVATKKDVRPGSYDLGWSLLQKKIITLPGLGDIATSKRATE